ncbi:hypothetical protein PDIG_79530 [Penicillium digitatum PHI26]|uniref:Uncharacterized protein n=3 Tax=Penicillium digitatum TaxID=36651 RepID=K9F9Q0_PEND2|nr:hypothetical protein PDIP_27920 [Penicillium digitatum Pd1]EKV06175.1 hypothetical protein PDIG_79530 [Penicillium digitatum PHI26]EKV18244.1 hypothetical protein PDIP_27920 [Penicillium digitatum Pd1]
MTYHGAFNATSTELKEHLEAVGEVVPQWRYSMYSQNHFHSTTQEMLGVVSGTARLCVGGEENPKRFEPTVQRGDLIIMPTRVSHQLLEDLHGDQAEFEMVGAYPHGKQWDLCYGTPEEKVQAQRIKDVVCFRQGPFYGADGSALYV